MRKDKKWLKEKADRLFFDNSMSNNPYLVAKREAITEISNLIDQLDEPEVLSQNWIDKHAVEGDFRGEQQFWYGRFIEEEKVKNLLVPKQDELEQTDTNVGLSKVVIPKFVAGYIEKWEHESLTIYEWFSFYNNDGDEDVNKWLYNNNIEENRRREYLLIDAIRYGYEVEKESVYYAKIKGHEFIQRIPTFDEDTGENTSDYYRSIYFVLQSDGDLIVDMKDSGLSGAKNVMTMSQWNNLGINETNADFEEIE